MTIDEQIREAREEVEALDARSFGASPAWQRIEKRARERLAALQSAGLSAPSPVVEARIQGMREGATIALDAIDTDGTGTCIDDRELSFRALDVAIAAIREGGGR
jgi:hypothetical protein